MVYEAMSKYIEQSWFKQFTSGKALVDVFVFAVGFSLADSVPAMLQECHVFEWTNQWMNELFDSPFERV